MKQSRRDLTVVFLVAFANHILTFLAYDWYAGIDAYSYDACGLQLMSGCFFDIFAVMLREPFIPIAKNILYLLFEGRPMALGILIHVLGISAALLAYRFGARFGRIIGLALGLLFAANLSLAAHFHHISATTFFIPSLIIAADRVCAWLKKPTVRRAVLMSAAAITLFLIRSEGILLIPAAALCGMFCARTRRQAFLFVFVTGTAYAGVSTLYYRQFGYFGITHKTGWVLFERVYRPADGFFDASAGPASARVSGFLNNEIVGMISKYDQRSAQMSAFMLAQKQFGYQEADSLFLRACLEGIIRHLPRFLYYTGVRTAAHLGLVDDRGLNHKEFPFETDTGHMWGFSEERALRERDEFMQVMEDFTCSPSPLAWERETIAGRFRGAGNTRRSCAEAGRWGVFKQNLFFNPDGSLYVKYRSDGNMSERLWTCRDLDIYFYFCFWGRKGYNKHALSALGAWDIFMPGRSARRFLDSGMMILWLFAVFFSKRYWQRCALGGFLLYVLGAGILQCVLSDNFGGRFALYTVVFVWLGGLCGVRAAVDIIREGKGD